MEIIAAQNYKALKALFFIQRTHRRNGLVSTVHAYVPQGGFGAIVCLNFARCVKLALGSGLIKALSAKYSIFQLARRKAYTG